MSYQPHVLLLLENNDVLTEIENIINVLTDNFSVYILLLENINKIGYYMSNYNIGVILSIGDDWKIYNEHISRFGFRFNKLWMHDTIEQFKKCNVVNLIMNCYMKNVINTDFYNDVISVFTTAYNSKELIYKPYNSLLQQTYKNWEFIIINDSDETHYNETQKILEKIANNDPRVKIFNYHKHSGYIGEVKNFASKMCHGYVTVEIDHDDELTDTLLEKLHQIYKNNSDVGFVYSDFCELYENKNSFTYGENFSFGYGSYTNQYYKDRWYSVANTPTINCLTLTDIIGVPNHVRTWRSSVLQQIGYFNDMLYVSDDYDLLLKTFLTTKMVRLPMLGYFQYRNEIIGNHTFKRNREIRNLQKWLSHKYSSLINDRIKQIYNNISNDKFYEELVQKNLYSQKISDEEINKLKCHTGEIIWEKPYDWQDINFNGTEYDNEKISIVISTFNREKLLKRAIQSIFNQTYQNFEIIIIGDKCPILEKVMQEYKTNKIIWWNLYKNYNDGGTTPKNYALRMCVRTNLIAYLDDDNYFEPTHLETLYNLFKKNNKLSYAFSSMIMGDYKILCKEPVIYRIDTSCIMHKRILLNKYGYWRTHEDVGYAHDYELVSRWKYENYDSTREFTMIYNLEGSNNNPELIYNAYDDQK